MTTTTPTATVTQAEPRKVKLQPLVTLQTAERLRRYAKARDIDQGKVIDELVEAHLPAVTVSIGPTKE